MIPESNIVIEYAAHEPDDLLGQGNKRRRSCIACVCYGIRAGRSSSSVLMARIRYPPIPPSYVTHVVVKEADEQGRRFNAVLF